MLTMFRGLAFAAVTVSALGLTGVAASAASVEYMAELNGPSEVPPTDSKGTGMLTATYDTTTKKLQWAVDYSGLSGPATMAHFHGPADTKTAAPIMIPITGSLASPIKGEATLTDAQAQALTDGKMYFNIHTAEHKSGEIRGQLEKAAQ